MNSVFFEKSLIKIWILTKNTLSLHTQLKQILTIKIKVNYGKED